MDAKGLSSDNTVWHHHQVTRAMRAEQKQQKPCLLWFTGLSGAGKSTLAGALEAELYKLGHHTYLLDGDNVRHGLNGDLGFTQEDRVENIRRIAELSKLFVDSGLIVLSAFISPFRAERRLARDLLGDDFVEVYVGTPLSTCEQRDPKGLYAKARDGKIQNFTGIDSPYEVPETPEVTIDTSVLSIAQSVEEMLAYMRQHQIIC